ncbi:RND transporter [Klebsiella pneumoniae]|uniref:RND transporter n=1 Tax=Klebsiella pneumoniae TaxID=573 RepID=UPI001D0D9370|nr:RND transporter [Klebsiella pneumoniae]
MNLKVLTAAFILVFPGLQSVHAADCTSNGLGGQFCVNDDGSTSDNMPNELNGMDTLSSDGSLTSTENTDSGADAELEGSNVDMTHQAPSKLSNKPDPALMGRDWNNPSNLGDGSATSSMGNTSDPGIQ